MLFFYVRHGDPIYTPDSLTPLGKRQAEAVAKRLAMYGVDRIYASTSTRAIMTAQPTCELLGKDMTLLDFCNESRAWEELTIDGEHQKTWLFSDAPTKLLFTEDSVRRLGFNWYEHPAFEKYNYKKGMERVYNELDKYMLELGYEHERYTGRYKVIKPEYERVALFAHQGFGALFMSCLMDIPYPEYCIHFDMCHTGMTAIEFKEEKGYAIPKVLTLSSDAHLYKEGLHTGYNRAWKF
ncbi:MAG: histidine phosphatase family protein [Clostridia bacterium]|nr:histidine phosphatase family protein [Clostridia bacterium]